MKFEELQNHGIDTTDALARFCGNRELYLKFLRQFTEDATYNALQENLNKGDYDEAFKTAHCLKGVTGNLSLNILYPASSELTDALRNGKADNIDELNRKVKESYAAVIKAIKALED